MSTACCAGVSNPATTPVWRAVYVSPQAIGVGFAIFSRVVIGQWFVGGDFFVPENKALGDWWLAAKEIGFGGDLPERRQGGVRHGARDTENDSGGEEAESMHVQTQNSRLG